LTAGACVQRSGGFGFRFLRRFLFGNLCNGLVDSNGARTSQHHNFKSFFVGEDCQWIDRLHHNRLLLLWLTTIFLLKQFLDGVLEQTFLVLFLFQIRNSVSHCIVGLAGRCGSRYCWRWWGDRTNLVFFVSICCC
jgi:hypothetical protein